MGVGVGVGTWKSSMSLAMSLVRICPAPVDDSAIRRSTWSRSCCKAKR